MLIIKIAFGFLVLLSINNARAEYCDIHLCDESIQPIGFDELKNHIAYNRSLMVAEIELFLFQGIKSPTLDLMIKFEKRYSVSQMMWLPSDVSDKVWLRSALKELTSFSEHGENLLKAYMYKRAENRTN